MQSAGGYAKPDRQNTADLGKHLPLLVIARKRVVGQGDSHGDTGRLRAPDFPRTSEGNASHCGRNCPRIMRMAATSSSARRTALRRLRRLIPPEPPAPPVRYTAPLIAYVAAVSGLALALAALTVRGPFDIPTLLFGALVIAALGAMFVRSLGEVDAGWTPIAFVHLALSFALGPIGALISAIAASVAVALRTHSGWFRALYNTSDCYLANMAAWWVYHEITQPSRGTSIWLAAAGGIAAGIACYVVNHTVVYGLLWLTRRAGLRDFLRGLVGALGYDLVFGLQAAGFARYFQSGGVVYFAMFVAPPIAVQVGLVVLSVRTSEYNADRERHARERVDLLQRMIRAGDDQRLAIAADLHDGHLNDLVGLALDLDALAESCTDQAAARALHDKADAVR